MGQEENDQKPSEIAGNGFSPDRREFVKLAVGGALSAADVSVGSTPDQRTAEGFLQIKKRYADAGITVWNIGNTSVHNMPEVTLNLPGRDQKIEEYKQYLRNLGKAGIYYTTYAHMGNGIWTSGRSLVRGASAREINQDRPEARGNWDGKVC